MSLKFGKLLTIGSNEWATSPFKFYGKDEMWQIGGSGLTPSWQDIVLTGNGSLTLTNAKANGLNYLKLFGKCEQKSVLPDEFQRVEYLETDGNQYIDTGVLLNNTDEFEITFQSSKDTLTTPVMGAISGGASYTSTDNISITYNVGSNVNAYSVYNNGAAGNPNYAWNGGDYTDKLKHTIKYTGLNTAPTIDGEAMTQINSHTISESNASVTTWLFGRNNTGAGTKAQDGLRIYDANFYSKGHFIPCCRKSDSVPGVYNLITGAFLTNAGTGDFTAGLDVTTPSPDNVVPIWCNNGEIKVNSQGQIYTDGTVETVTDSLNNTATAEMLLSVGDYKDEQSVLDGAVTRNIGIKVFDGTEEWTWRSKTDGSLSYCFVDVDNININTETEILCSHYGISGRNIPTFNKVCVRLARNGFVICDEHTATSATELQSYLADQYAQGTPVTIIYPLATPTTETVTAQPLTIQAGTNIITAEGSIDNLELEISYKGKAG